MAASDDENEQLTNGSPADDGPDDAEFDEANALDAPSEEADVPPEENEAETEDEEVPRLLQAPRIFCLCLNRGVIGACTTSAALSKVLGTVMG